MEMYDRNALFLFLIALFLSAFGPISLGIPIVFNTSYGLMRLCIGVAILLTIFRLFKRHESIIPKTPIVIYLVLYGLALVASLFFAIRLEDGMRDVFVALTGGLFFYVAYNTVRSAKSLWFVVATIVIAASGVSLLSLFAFAFPDGYQDFARRFLDRNVSGLYLYNRERGRIFPLWDIEATIPFFLLYAFKGNMKQIVGSTVGSVVVLFAVFLANFRYRFVSVLFSIISFFYLSGRKKNIVPFFALFTSIFFFYVLSAKTLLNVTLLDRFFIQDRQSFEPIQARIEMGRQAFEMFLSSPIFGIGTGNYFYNFNWRINYAGPEKYYFGIPLERFLIVVYENYKGPHNILFSAISETGIFGLTTLLLLLVKCLEQDVRLYRRYRQTAHKDIVSTFIISFWTFIVGSMFINMFTALGAVILLWSIRGILSSIETHPKALTTSE